jgi:hypothetical protein
MKEATPLHNSLNRIFSLYTKWILFTILFSICTIHFSINQRADASGSVISTSASNILHDPSSAQLHM